MFCFNKRLLEKVPFATLFRYNAILQSVFSAPAHKEAIVLEIPGKIVESYTYGRLQKDVLSMANLITERRETIMEARQMPSLSWLQTPRTDSVHSIFADRDNGISSLEFRSDDGRYNVAILGETSYSFVVSLLAAWSLNQMAVPLSATQKYTAELSYILEHSKSRTIMGDTTLLKETLSTEYDGLMVRNLGDMRNLQAPPSNTYNVDTVFDVKAILGQIQQRCEPAGSENGMLHPDHLLSKEEKHHIDDAHDILDRLNNEKRASEATLEALRQQMIREEFKAHSTVPYAGDDSGLCYDTDFLDYLNPVHRRWVEDYTSCPSKHDDCVMIYTSGTTANPKGAVHTHAGISNMVNVLQLAWEWSREDTILHVLPIYHIHGLVNILLCSLASNARCILTRPNDLIRIAHRLERGDISLFMGVPTLYTNMIAAVKKKMSPIEQEGFKKIVSRNIRLMVSGSAPLPVPIINQFREISGHTLLERYGMTEVGMALSQPLRPVSKRIPGTVGTLLPTVRAFVQTAVGEPASTRAERTETTIDSQSKGEFDEIGQLAIASESLFDRYWSNPEATKKEVVRGPDGRRYFNTGDTVGVRKPLNSDGDAVFTILGRTSVDIIKSRGYKISALEIEAILLSRKDLFFEVAVVGCPDSTLGEKVVAVVAPQTGALQRWNIPANFGWFESLELNKELNAVASTLLARYKCPERFIILPQIPRNPTGKVNKRALKEKLSLN